MQNNSSIAWCQTHLFLLCSTPPVILLKLAFPCWVTLGIGNRMDGQSYCEQKAASRCFPQCWNGHSPICLTSNGASHFCSAYFKTKWAFLTCPINSALPNQHNIKYSSHYFQNEGKKWFYPKNIARHDFRKNTVSSAGASLPRTISVVAECHPPCLFPKLEMLPYICTKLCWVWLCSELHQYF